MSVKDAIDALNSHKYALARSLLTPHIESHPENGGLWSILAHLEYKQNNREEALSAARKAVATGQLKMAIIASTLAPLLVVYGESALLARCFEDFLRKNSSDAKAVDIWTDYSFELSHVRGLLRAQTVANKLGSTDRTILNCCYFMALEHKRLNKNDAEYRLYPALANKMLDKVRPTHDPQAAFIEALVLRMNSQDKMIEFLLDKTVRAYESLDLDLMLLEALVSAERWEEVYEYAVNQLARLDSYNYWLALIRAAIKLDRVQSLNQLLLAAKKSHNSLLAAVELQSQLELDVIPGITELWDHLADRPAAVDFIRPYLRPHVAKYLETRKAESFTEQVNLIKIEYLKSRRASIPMLVSRYSGNLDKLPQEGTDYFIGDDLILIAAVEVLRSSDEYKLQKAATLLEYARKHGPNQFYVQIWLIKMYQHLGAFTKALEIYRRLQCKNMQHESLGHLLLTRCGSLYHDRKMLNLFKDTYEQADSIGLYAYQAMKSGAYTQIEGMLELGLKMRTSLSRRMLEIETLKTERLLKGTAILGTVLNSPVELSDNRDFDTVFDPCHYLNGQLESGPRPGEKWVSAQIEKERVYLSALRGAHAGPVPVDSPELTEYEKWNIKTINYLGQGQVKLDQVPLPKPRLGWEFFHACYTILETCKIVDDYCAKHKLVASGETKQAREAVKNLATTLKSEAQNEAIELTAKVEAWASELKVPDSQSVLSSLLKSQMQSVQTLASV